MAEVVLLRGAEGDLLEIYNSLAEFDLSLAERFSSMVDRTFHDLTKFPELGRPDLGSMRRKLVVGFYRFGVYYQIEAERILIHAVLDLRQDPEMILRRLR